MPTPTPLPPPPLVGVPHTPPRVDLPTKRRRKHARAQKPRRDNRKSRYDADYTGDDERYNAQFAAYYAAQRIVPADELDELLATLAIPLPTSFRVTADGAFRDDIQQTLQGEMTQLFERAAQEKGGAAAGGDEERVAVKPPSQLGWYPDGLAWTVSAPRQMLRRDNVLSPFHKFLVRMNELGAINRQEAVSMIPPLMLDAWPGQSVLDMCAAPGSKTAQILERVSPRGRGVSEVGVVIANDADIKRCWMLAHQLKRFGSAELVVTQHEAQHFPKFMAFDRVLCDVPCTGDGTLRKAPDIWRRWTPDMGIGIHRLQRQILERGIELLKPGGRLVYSTCSMNPVENEAVVAHALRKFGEDIELVDCSDALPGLRRRPGLTTWLVKDNSGKVERRGGVEEQGASVEQGGRAGGDEAEGCAANERASSAGQEEEEEEGEGKEESRHGWFTGFEEVPVRRRKKIVRSLFPPSAEEAGSGRFALERCMRLVPQDQDTGAFFVSVLVKPASARLTRRERREAAGDVAEAGAQASEAGSDPETRAGDVRKKTGRAGGTRLITDDPLVSVGALCGATLRSISGFFGLDAEVMGHCLMTRGSDGTTFKRVVAVSRTARTVLRHALGTRDREVAAGGRVVRVVNAGVRVLERTDRRDTACGFRLVHDGAHVMRAAMRRRVVAAAPGDVRALLGGGVVRTDRAGAGDGAQDGSGTEEDGAVRADGTVQTDGTLWRQVAALGSGSALVCCGARDEVVVWVGKRVVSAVMPREVVDALRARLGGAPLQAPPTDAQPGAPAEAQPGAPAEAQPDAQPDEQPPVQVAAPAHAIAQAPRGL